MMSRYLILPFAAMLFGCSSLKTSSFLAEVAGQEDYNTESTPDIPTDLGLEEGGERNAAEIAADQLSRSTFPLVHNQYVQKWLDFFTGRGRKSFEVYLSRSTRYIPVMQQVLKEEGLPEDLIYLSMIESGFNPRAYSRAAAVGPWQFIRGTGKRYGLEVSTWIDERRDVMKSTRAAAQYLGELHTVFGSWYLAAASYNAGEGRVLNAVREMKTRNFWEIQRKRGMLRAETRNYVPKIIAAAMISKNPEKYGFTNIDYQRPLAWKTVEIGERKDLKSLAQIAAHDYEEIRILNAELRLEVTPPGKNYEVRVPPETFKRVAANVSNIKTRVVPLFAKHRIRRGETLSQIARRYRVRVRDILNHNNIRSAHTIRAGKPIKVPLNKNARNIASYTSSGSTHRVRRGENLSSIARKYGVSVEAFVRVNNLRSASKIYVGQRLKIPGRHGTANASSTSSVHKVRRGQSLSIIARKYGTTVQTLVRHNRLRSPNDLRVGQRIKIPGRGMSSMAPGKTQKIRVRAGDSLWEISQKYGTSVNKLKRMNNLASARNLQAGDYIIVPVN